MAPLQRLLYQMLGSLIVIVVASRDDSNLTLTVHNREDVAVTRVAKPNSVSHTISQYCKDVCENIDRRIECINCIPRNVTSAVTEIVLSGFNESCIVPYMFCGVSWPGVVNLTILNPKLKSFNIRDFSFDCLPRIEILKLGLLGLSSLSVNAFYGLENTRTLDLTNCVNLEISELTPSLSLFTNLPKLQTLILSNFGSYSAYGVNQVSQIVLDNAARRSLTDIDLSYSTFDFNQNDDFTGVCNCLEKLNLEKTRLSTSVINFPSRCALREINLSGVSFPTLPIPVGNFTFEPDVYIVNQPWMKALSNVSILYLNRLIPAENNVFINNATFDIQIENLLTEIHLSGYSVPVFEGKFLINPNHVEYIDMSNNKIERLSRDLLAYLEHLKRIDLSDNRLALSKQLEDTFLNLFRNNSKLEIVRLSSNGLKYLPSKVFELNFELKEIDISKNKVTQIPFEISHLHNLELLDLRGNAIDYLNTWSTHQLDILYKIKQNTTVSMPYSVDLRDKAASKSFTVDLRDNPFSCKCHSLEFIKWFVQSPLFEYSRDRYHCELDNESISMDTRAIKRSQLECEKPQREARRRLLMIFLPCISTVILVSMAIISFKLYKRQKMQRRLREQLHLIYENQSEFRFPVFLSYASEDSEFVEPNILQPLEACLKNLTYCDRDLVAIGDRYFRLGRSIFAEIIRMLEDCAVFVVVLSKNYCFSDYCKHEIEQARLMRKPIVIIMKEFVQEGDMNGVIKETFKHYTRATFRFNEEEWRLEQDWKYICQSIIELL